MQQPHWQVSLGVATTLPDARENGRKAVAFGTRLPHHRSRRTPAAAAPCATRIPPCLCTPRELAQYRTPAFIRPHGQQLGTTTVQALPAAQSSRAAQSFTVLPQMLCMLLLWGLSVTSSLADSTAESSWQSLTRGASCQRLSILAGEEFVSKWEEDDSGLGCVVTYSFPHSQHGLQGTSNPGVTLPPHPCLPQLH